MIFKNSIEKNFYGKDVLENTHKNQINQPVERKVKISVNKNGKIINKVEYNKSNQILKLYLDKTNIDKYKCKYKTIDELKYNIFTKPRINPQGEYEDVNEGGINEIDIYFHEIMILFDRRVTKTKIQK